jgi:hypothetical protein
MFNISVFNSFFYGCFEYYTHYDPENSEVAFRIARVPFIFMIVSIILSMVYSYALSRENKEASS